MMPPAPADTVAARTGPATPRPLPAVRIGDIELESPFAQAALSGYSDWPMRAVARRYGASYTVHEVMIERFVQQVRGTGATAHHFRVTDDDHPVGGQLMGSTPENFPPAAQRLAGAGFDVIDINFGCPVKSAIGGCRGGYHLSQPAVAIEIVRRVRDAVPESIPVTVKMRRGIDDSSESRDRFFTILEGAFDAGAAAITVHGRTVEQKYVGPSQWSFLREVRQFAGDRTILGSGDLFTAADCLRMLEQTGVDGVSIARGAIGNPWIFRHCQQLAAGAAAITPPDVHEQREALLLHARFAREVLHNRCFSSLRKISIKYARNHPQHTSVRNAFATARSLEQWEAVIANWYARNAPGRFPDTAE